MSTLKAEIIETAARVGKEVATQPTPKPMSADELKAACAGVMRVKKSPQDRGTM